MELVGSNCDIVWFFSSFFSLIGAMICQNVRRSKSSVCATIAKFKEKAKCSKRILDTMTSCKCLLKAILNWKQNFIL